MYFDRGIRHSSPVYIHTQSVLAQISVSSAQVATVVTTLKGIADRIFIAQCPLGFSNLRSVHLLDGVGLVDAD